RDVQRLPELAFAGGAIAAGNVHNLVAVMTDVLSERCLLGLRECFSAPLVIQRGFGRTYCLQELRSRAGRLADNVKPRLSPMRGHLPPPGAGIVLRTYGRQKCLVRR